MKIRTRLTLWYAAILFVATATIAGIVYHDVTEEKRELHKSEAEAKEDAAESEGFSDAMKLVLWCGLPATIIGLAGGWFLMRKALGPVTALTQSVEKIDEGNLRQQLPRSGNGDELDRLTEVFNRMTGRLDTSFQRIREFTLHASHELKTPLTVMRGEIETALREENSTGQQRERLQSQLEEIQRLGTIVDALTLLTKADAGQVTLELKSVCLDELVREAHEDAKILAQSQGIDVCLKDCEPVTVQGDRHRLRQLLLNLTDNAIKYNQANGTVTIRLARSSGKMAELTITNTGPGIPAEKLPRVFDRFFRCDESHNSAKDGCGLGLSIVQWIVSAHGGSVAISSEPGKITTVTVRLPAE